MMESHAEILRVLIPSPIGLLGVEVRGKLAHRIVIDPQGTDLEDFRPFDEVESSEFLDDLLGSMSEYFAGARRVLNLGYSLRDLGLTGFTRKVFRFTARIPYGKTRHYGEIAAAAGRPDAYRLVLSLLMTNPLPILIPCHRVVTRKSGIGSYIGGDERKRWLLDLESEALADLSES